MSAVQQGLVYDVTSHDSGRELYGPGTSYGDLWAGKDATRSLATMDFKQTVWLFLLKLFTVGNPFFSLYFLGNFTQGCDLSDLNAEQLKTLEEWVVKYQTKYKVVGKLA